MSAAIPTERDFFIDGFLSEYRDRVESYDVLWNAFQKGRLAALDVLKDTQGETPGMKFSRSLINGDVTP